MQPRPSFAVQQPVCIYIVYYDEKKEKKSIKVFLSLNLASQKSTVWAGCQILSKKKKEKKKPPVEGFFFTIFQLVTTFYSVYQSKCLHLNHSPFSQLDPSPYFLV